MEEQNKDRVNVKRTLQLIDAFGVGAPNNNGTEAKTVASACPFCMTMLKDGVKSQSKEDEIQNLDVVELLAQSCLPPAPAASPAA
jgi:Fe-S oxidoreductase